LGDKHRENNTSHHVNKHTKHIKRVWQCGNKHVTAVANSILITDVVKLYDPQLRTRWANSFVRSTAVTLFAQSQHQLSGLHPHLYPSSSQCE